MGAIGLQHPAGGKAGPLLERLGRDNVYEVPAVEVRNLEVDVVLTQSHRNWLKGPVSGLSPPMSTVSYGGMHDLPA